jgi:hypothetical protein
MTPKQIKSEINKLTKELNKVNLSTLKKDINKFFKDNPEVESFCWTQYEEEDFVVYDIGSGDDEIMIFNKDLSDDEQVNLIDKANILISKYSFSDMKSMFGIDAKITVNRQGLKISPWQPD